MTESVFGRITRGVAWKSVCECRERVSVVEGTLQSLRYPDAAAWKNQVCTGLCSTRSNAK